MRAGSCLCDCVILKGNYSPLNISTKRNNYHQKAFTNRRFIFYLFLIYSKKKPIFVSHSTFYIPLNLAYIIYIDTATATASVVLFEDAEAIASIVYQKGRTHAKLIAPMIQTLLRDLEIPMEKIAAVAVSKGPGSYTGLRVGVSTAKGLCLALDIPLISMNSLLYLAANVQIIAKTIGAWICPMIDARRMEVYCAFYDENLEEKIPTKAEIIEENHFTEILQTRKVIFTGDGAEKCKAIFDSFENAILIPDTVLDFANIGRIIYEKYEIKEFENVETYEPFYLKNYVATVGKKKFL